MIEWRRLRLAFPPAFVLALLIALIGTQVAYVSAPKKPKYLIRLALSVGAIGAGEAMAAMGVGLRFSLGDLHLANDLLLLGLAQWAVTHWSRGLGSRAPR